jgi:hypothetical protein
VLAKQAASSPAASENSLCLLALSQYLVGFEEFNGEECKVFKPLDIGGVLSQQVAKLFVYGYLLILVPKGLQGTGLKFPWCFYPKNPATFHSVGLPQK